MLAEFGGSVQSQCWTCDRRLGLSLSVRRRSRPRLLLTTIQRAATICLHWLRTNFACSNLQVRRVGIILAGNPNQRKKRVSSGVGECCPHAARGGNVTDGAYGPIRGN